MLTVVAGALVPRDQVPRTLFTWVYRENMLTRRKGLRDGRAQRPSSAVSHGACRKRLELRRDVRLDKVHASYIVLGALAIDEARADRVPVEPLHVACRVEDVEGF